MKTLITTHRRITHLLKMDQYQRRIQSKALYTF